MKFLNKFPVTPGDVLYVSLEDSERRLKKRLQAALGNAPIPERLYVAIGFPRLDQGALKKLRTWLQQHPDARMIIVDTLAKLRARNPARGAQYMGDYTMMGELKSLADEFHVAIVIVHHTRKARSDDPLDEVCGSVGLTGAADSVFVLRRERTRADGELFVSGRDVNECAYALSSSPDTGCWSVIGPADDYQMSRERQEIIDLLRKNGDSMSPSAIADALGRKNGTIRKILGEMRKAGQVRKADRGQYTAERQQDNSGSGRTTHNGNNITGQGDGGQDNQGGVGCAGNFGNTTHRTNESDAPTNLTLVALAGAGSPIGHPIKGTTSSVGEAVPKARVRKLNVTAKLASGTKKMGGKPVYEVTAKTVINTESGFGHKKLCDGLTFSAGSACVYKCLYCYVPDLMCKNAHLAAVHADNPDAKHPDIVIRRQEVLEILRGQLTDRHGQPKFNDLKDTRVIYASPLVDVAPNLELADETVECCRIILDLTNWQIRLLSKSNLLPRIAEALGDVGRDRVIYGVSTGTLDDNLARVIEVGTPLVSKRLASLRWLQDQGFRTFGMICPNLPQRDYVRFATEMRDAIRAEHCEHIWGEVLNVRGESLTRTAAALHAAGYHWEADELGRVDQDKAAWEAYARATFEAHAALYSPDKLRFLQYVGAGTRPWWKAQEARGAILLK